MNAREMLELWWTVPAGLALLGYGLSLAGLTRTQRAVWVRARISQVHRPAHGASKHPGIPVTVTFQDPSSGREFVRRNAGKHGDAIEEAWVGRELAVRYPRGRPERFRVALHTAESDKGRGGPNCAVVLLLVGLIVHAAVARGYPWALLGFGALLAVITAAGPDLRTVRSRDALLSSAVAVPAQVVAVARNVYTDGEGDDVVVHTPVVCFTAHEGTQVTVLVRDGIPGPGRSLGRELTVHYAPSDLSVYTCDLAAERRSNEKWVGVIIMLFVAGVSATVVGAVLL
ncbi:DUF3592 domain-containing protein [Streptomyces sp. NBC_00199]|uniref:DUF3592 domain-containing protein n=1 Tax=Streptomyces sp. NBC_00199 TaxID=2975678 RepID=UPI002256EA68|nr:DUF3592 domain-containing protein [Streptomyces sp. NBC_00199]MCX5264619.1 DUF3592 domain-containing protein [Streptomyces sp. NBC_00199]